MQEFRRHLIDAIRRSTARKPRYAALTNDESLPISIQLIVWEKLAIPVAWYFDHMGDRYQRQGIPFIRAEMVEGRDIPPFAETYPPGIPYWEPAKRYSMNSLARSIRRATRAKDFERVFQLCEFALLDLSTQVHVNCCVRHLLESVRRVATLVEHHERQCSQLGIKPPTTYSQQLIMAHLWVMEQAEDLDRRAAVIQNAGVPILFQDLPFIDLGGDFAEEAA